MKRLFFILKFILGFLFIGAAAGYRQGYLITNVDITVAAFITLGVVTLADAICSDNDDDDPDSFACEIPDIE